MHVARVKFRGVTPYSQSRPHNTPHLENELDDDYERRTWRERLHVDESGIVFIPPMSMKNGLVDLAAYRSEKIRGKGNTTWTKFFEAGVMVLDGIPLGIQKDDVEPEWLFLNSDGKKGGGRRVWKCYPLIRQWGGTVDYQVLDSTITEDKLTDYVTQFGMFIGIGRFRPRKGGFYGRFAVDKVDWK